MNRYISRLHVIAEFELRALINYPWVLLGRLFVEPIVYTAFLAGGLQGLFRQNFDFLSFAMPGILAIQILRAFGTLIYRITVEHRWGIFALKKLSGIDALAYWLGLLVIHGSVMIVQSIVIFIVILMLGSNVAPWFYLKTIIVAIAVLGFWVSVAFILAAKVNNYKQRDTIVNLLLLPMTFSAPVFYSLEVLPKSLRVISLVNPLTYQVLAMRSVFMGGGDTLSLAIVLLEIVVIIPVYIRTFRNSEVISSNAA